MKRTPAEEEFSDMGPLFFKKKLSIIDKIKNFYYRLFPKRLTQEEIAFNERQDFWRLKMNQARSIPNNRTCKIRPIKTKEWKNEFDNFKDIQEENK